MTLLLFIVADRVIKGFILLKLIAIHTGSNSPTIRQGSYRAISMDSDI